MLHMGTNLSRAAGTWERCEMPVKTRQGTLNKVLRYRSVRKAVEFLIGHQAFRDDLIYEPYRQWTADEPRRRCYSDMASADWWWDTQKRLNIDNATIIPIILASDKTLVTRQQGDKKAYPVYMTIGNLPAHIRNSNVRPGVVPLGLLPILTDGSVAARCELLHACLARMLNPVAMATPGEGWDILCADGMTRRCFPVIAAMTIDHEEQAVMAGTRGTSQCPLCEVDPKQREDLEIWAPWRTHNDMQHQIHRQRRMEDRNKGLIGNRRRTKDEMAVDQAVEVL